MPAARATSSVEVPWKPVLAKAPTATRSTSARRSVAVMRVAGDIMATIVSDDSLTCQARREEVGAAAEALQETGVGLGRLRVPVRRVAVVVAVVAGLPDRELARRDDEAADSAAGPGGLPQREAELHVGVAIEPRLAVRACGCQRHRPAHGEQVAED